MELTNQDAANILTTYRSKRQDEDAALALAVTILTDGFQSDTSAIQSAETDKTTAITALEEANRTITEKVDECGIFRARLIDLGEDPDALLDDSE